MQIEVCFFNIN